MGVLGVRPGRADHAKDNMKKKKHSKRYDELAKLIDPNKEYSLEEALELLPKTASTKFDASVELHVRLGIDLKKSDQQLRSTITLPHGTGKDMRVAAFAEEAKQKEAKDAGADPVGGQEMVEEIAKTGKCDFDVAVSTTEMMKKLSKVAKVLGPRNLMPSPKNETVTDDLAKIIGELKKGKVTLKNDSTGNVHQLIGKSSWEAAKIGENATAILEEIRKRKPAGLKKEHLLSVTLTTSMGPGIRIVTQ